MTFDVQGSTALVTGANRGIGKVITERLLAHGAKRVYAAVRDVDSAKTLVDEHGDKIVPIEVDLTRPETIEAAAKEATDVNLVINNAGVLRTSDALSETIFDDLNFELEVNLHGMIRVARAFAPVLAANGGGAFVQLNSVASMKSFPEFATYCVSKAASYSMTQALKTTLGKQGTAVHSVHPGPIATDMAASAGLGEGAEPPALVAEAIIAALASGEFHVYPDAMAKQVGEAYGSFANNVVESEMSEA